MDEIGRGTSTYDGLSLAWACAEQLASKIRAFTLFATHYFELTQLPEQIPALANVHLDAVEHGDGIAFMHAVQEGAANRSYGLQVASLAGVPKTVIQRAKLKLHELEHSSQHHSGDIVPVAPVRPLESDESEAIVALKALDPDALTPRQALDALYRLRQLL